MEKKIQLFMVAAIVAAGFVGCSSEEVLRKEGGPDEQGGPETYSSLVVRDATPGTYGTTAEDIPLSTEILESKDNLKAFVFESDGTPANVSFAGTDTEIKFDGTGPYTSNPFKITSDSKYFYVLADQNTVKLGINQGVNRGAYERRAIPANFTNSTENVAGSTEKRVEPLPKNLATSGEFLMGTLWGKLTSVPSSSLDPLNPVTITGLTIGRLASKVNLVSVTDGGKFPANGVLDFANATYRLCSVPDAMYLVGQWDGANEPGTHETSPVVKSIYHDESYGPDISKQNPKFKNYQWAGAYKVNTPYYTVENTSALQTDPHNAGSTIKHQYYGNTTYIQMKLHFAPAQSIIHDKEGNLTGTVLTGGTFWMYMVNGQYKIFREEALSNVPGIDMDSGVKYEGGFMYYSFVIRDNSETDPVTRNAVLRNHSYNVRVTEIKKFGVGVPDEVKPYVPVEEDTWVKLEVSVLPWSKIEQGVPL